jgi:Na+/phosphate symporter
MEVLHYAIKVAVSALLVVAVSEIAKRHSLFAALVASLPIVSVLSMIWLYIETSDAARISELSHQIFWLVIPSLALLLLLPAFLKWGFGFWLSLGAAVAATIVCYFVTLYLIRTYM